MSQNGDNLYKELQVPFPVSMYSQVCMDAQVLTINTSGTLLNQGDILLDGKIMNSSTTNIPYMNFNGSYLNISGVLMTNKDISLGGVLTSYNNSLTPYIKFNSSIINVSGALIANNDLSISGKMMCYNSSQTPFLNFNGSSINVSSTLVNTNSGYCFSKIGSDPGIPYCDVQPTTVDYPWALPGRLYYTTMEDSAGNPMKYLCIV